MRVRLVTPWGTACGIAEHSRMLTTAVSAAMWGSGTTPIWLIEPNLHPDAFWAQHALGNIPDVLLLNYHAGLHSQWTGPHVIDVRAAGVPVVVVYHDTGVPNSDQCKAMHWAVTAPIHDGAPGRFIVHEPADDLPGAIYLRQGVPDWRSPRIYDQATYGLTGGRPLLGTVGFPFPWKNYDLLVDATAAAGWALLLLAPGTPESQTSTWRVRNPHMLTVADFIPADAVVAYLGGCDATAFLYTCANTGTSGAIRQGLAARKPVLATRGCRQFRDLASDPLGARAITWLDDLSVEGVATALETVRLQRVDPAVVRLADRDSWRGMGQRYAEVLREVTGRVVHGVKAQQVEGQPS